MCTHTHTDHKELKMNEASARTACRSEYYTASFTITDSSLTTNTSPVDCFDGMATKPAEHIND